MNENPVRPVTTPAMLGLDTDKRGVVHYQSAPLALPRKEKGVLLLLLREWPAMVDKACFAREVWDGDMSDESLARCVTKLRGALKGIAGIRIRSIYGQGYQLQVETPAQPLTEVIAPPVAYSRLLDAARVAPALAESLMHARMLIQQRTNSSLERAEALLRTMMAQAPDYVPAKIAFAECLAGQVSCGWGLRPAHLEEGLKLLVAVARHTPQAPGLWSQKGHLLDCAWRFDEAERLHALALKTKADDPATHYHQGWHLLACGRPDQALLSFHDAYALAPFSPALAIMMARAHTFVGQSDIALRYAQQACEDHPESSQAYVFWLVNEAFVHPREELIEKLLEVPLNALSWSFAPSSVSYGLALCGARKEAAAVVARSVDDNPSVRATYTSTMLLLGDAEGAQQRIEAAAQLACGFLPISLLSPANRRLRDHPRYAAVHAAVFRKVTPPPAV
jgi:tetratricopeptide (TPR) repeat protein